MGWALCPCTVYYCLQLLPTSSHSCPASPCHRHHVYRKTNHRNVELTEVGPRFELKLYMIRQGTLEQEATADVEWRWHPYTNTAHKRVFLSAE